MEEAHKERLKNVAKVAVPIVLGGLAVKNIRERSTVRHISYWEASRTFIIDLINEGQNRATRLSGTVVHGPGGREDLQDVELYEGFEYQESEVEELERAFERPEERPN